MTPVTGLPNGVVAYNINGGVNGEKAEAIFAAFNATKSAATVTLPEGEWHICVNGEDAGVTSLGTATGTVSIDAQSALILVKGDVQTDDDLGGGNKTPINLALLLPIIAAAVVGVAIVVVLVLKKKK